MRILTLLAVLLSSVVYAQAVRPAPAPAAAPPPRPGATYAPAGTGASHGGLTAPEAAVPRSPNKRPLPPSREVGLWAADGAPVAMADSTIFGVYIPPPVSETSDDLSREHGMCTATMSVAAFFPTDTGIGEHSEPVRACLAARAYLYCAIRMGEEGLMRAFAKHSPGWNPVAVRRTMQPHAEALVKKMCADATISGHQQHALEEAERQWGQGMRRSR